MSSGFENDLQNAMPGAGIQPTEEWQRRWFDFASNGRCDRLSQYQRRAVEEPPLPLPDIIIGQPERLRRGGANIDRMMDVLSQREWQPEAPPHFSGTSFVHRPQTLQQRLDVYRAEQPGYFQRIAGMSEQEFLQRHREYYERRAREQVRPVTVGELRARYAAIPRPAGPAGTVFTVTGLDALSLALSNVSQGSICQVASQFNGLESTSTQRATLTSYATDFTQGPRSVMPCLHELATREVSDFNAFARMLSADDRNRFIRNGYVQWGNNPQAFLDCINGRSDDLLVLGMVARPELADHSVLQVYAAAPPTSAYGNSGDREVQRRIARQLVIPQYEAIAMMAVIRAHQTGREVNLNLTLVGGGVFGNDPVVLNEAIERVREIVRNHAVRVAIHVFNPNELSRYPILRDLPTMNASQFLQGAAPQQR